MRQKVSLLILICSLPFLPLPWCDADQFTQAKSSWTAGETYEGVTIAADLPASQQFKNVGAKRDGAGMCVDSSIEMAARHQGLEQMRGFRDWAAAKFPGGNYPQGVDKQLKIWFAEKKLAPIPYLQYEGPAPEIIMDVASKTGRMICLTYGYSPRYGGTKYIAHMVCSPLLGSKYGVILDNNFPLTASKLDNYEWMDRGEMIRRNRLQQGGKQGNGWVFLWLAPPPPPRTK